MKLTERQKEIKQQGFIICPRCTSTSDIYAITCSKCHRGFFNYETLGEIRSNLSFKAKVGNRIYGLAELGRIQRDNSKHAKDLIQPTRQYDRVHKEFKTNPDFVKHYGDPFKDQNIKDSKKPKTLNE